MPGYAAIYLAGVNWGHYLVNAETTFRAHYAHIARDFCELRNPFNYKMGFCSIVQSVFGRVD